MKKIIKNQIDMRIGINRKGRVGRVGLMGVMGLVGRGDYRNNLKFEKP
jgi:hypothetical protein